MKIKHKICYSLIGVMLLISSCEKLVDAGDPLTTITTEKTFSRDGSAYAALTGLYSLMINGSLGSELIFSNGAMTLYPGMSSDELQNYAGVSNEIDYNFTINKLDSRNDNVKKFFWTPIYKLIFNANSIIEGIAASTSNQLTPEARKQITAEAKFVRAFSYFYLTNLFGNVPLLTSTDWKANAQLPRASSDEVYALIIQDLLDAQRDLPEDYAIGGGERIRANKFVATALLARTYLFQKDWKNAETQSSLIIGNSQFSLEENLNDVFVSTSRESIWQLKPSLSKPNAALNDAIKFTPDLWWKDILVNDRIFYLDKSVFPDIAFIFYPAYIMTPQLSASFETGDKRLVDWTSFVETPTYAPYTGITDRFPTKYTSPSSEKKYYTVFRLAEQLLIRAEARAHLDNLSGADEDINAVRDRADLEDITSGSREAALDAVAHERRIELFGEWGHRWFDLKRTGKALEVLKNIPQKLSNPDQLLYPVPFDEIQADPNLSQNPGY